MLSLLLSHEYEKKKKGNKERKETKKDGKKKERIRATEGRTRAKKSWSDGNTPARNKNLLSYPVLWTQRAKKYIFMLTCACMIDR